MLENERTPSFPGAAFELIGNECAGPAYCLADRAAQLGGLLAHDDLAAMRELDPYQAQLLTSAAVPFGLAQRNVQELDATGEPCEGVVHARPDSLCLVLRQSNS